MKRHLNIRNPVFETNETKKCPILLRLLVSKLDTPGSSRGNGLYQSDQTSRSQKVLSGEIESVTLRTETYTNALFQNQYAL